MRRAQSPDRSLMLPTRKAFREQRCLLKEQTTGQQPIMRAGLPWKTLRNRMYLLISFIGYLKERIPVGNQTEIRVLLNQDLAQIEEVMITAVGIKSEKKAIGLCSPGGKRRRCHRCTTNQYCKCPGIEGCRGQCNQFFGNSREPQPTLPSGAGLP